MRFFCLLLVLALTGCTMPFTTTKVESPSPLTLTQQGSTLLLKIYWPSTFHTAAIPAEANSIRIEVYEGDRILDAKTVRREAGSESTTVSFQLTADTLFNIQAKAFREADPTTDSVPIACASASNVKLAPSKSMKLPLTLSLPATLQVKLGDLPSDTWTPMSSLVIPRAGLITGEIEGQLFAFSGENGLSMEFFDPESLSWRYRAFSASDGFSHATGAAIGEHVYLIGGLTGGSSSNSLYSINPESGPDGRVSLHDYGRADAASAILDGKIYVIGGHYQQYGAIDSDWAMNCVEVYDPEQKIFEKAAYLPDGRGGLAAVTLDGQIYAVGGYDGENHPTGTVYRYLFASNEWSTQTSAQVDIAALPTPRFGFGMVAVDGKLYAVGGMDASGNVLSSVEEYDPSTNTWTEKAPMPTARVYLSCVAAGGRIWAIGGYGADGRPLRTVETYQP